MIKPSGSAAFASGLLLTLMLAACGGGGSSTPAAAAPAQVAAVVPVESDAPAVTGNTATDGFNRFNFRRQKMGLAALSRNPKIDAAAQGHSNYQKVNDRITHLQKATDPGFTGVNVSDRLTAANYAFTATDGYAYGEVISASGDLSGVNNAEDLITAIYHRFVIFEPKFLEAGAATAGLSTTGYNFFTVDFAANGLSGGLGTGKFAVYPYPNQVGINTVFMSDQESPDPVPNQNAVGYPISVHADIDTTLTVSSFTVTPRGGQPLSTRLLSHVTDPVETPAGAAAIIPLSVLAAATTYDVQFTGTVSNLPVTKSWSFTTR
ncbi:uncharacterized protein YkwD [Actimicrobium sp. GrIS 1.19]|uniref:CAP domain-containing protein n=1 Tax=Actimicrobium sp. GrIS 1.19 TaxID=3071708 RepID=UPI002DFE6ED9|nr:uncharacterized protein YkwD [Actimicrobium sp. GrIS 1.19]